MIRIWSRRSVAFLAILVFMSLTIMAQCLYESGRPGEVVTVWWTWFAFVGIVSFLGGIYGLERTGKRILEIDLFLGMLIMLPPFLHVIHVLRLHSANLESDIMLPIIAASGFYYLLRCLFALGTGAVRVWQRNEPGRLVQGARLLCAGLLLVAVPAGVKGGWFHEKIQYARMSRTAGEIRNVDLACTKLLSDAAVSRFSALFEEPALLERATVQETIEYHTTLAYELLNKGRNADIGLKKTLQQKLGTSYMTVGNDPWGHRYRFYFGPLKESVNRNPLFRCHRAPWEDAAGIVHDPYVFDMAAYKHENGEDVRRPAPEPDVPALPGYPCPSDLAVYVFSYGANGQPNQPPWGGDGRDDINNWDNAAGWQVFY